MACVVNLVLVGTLPLKPPNLYIDLCQIHRTHRLEEENLLPSTNCPLASILIPLK